MHFQTEYFSTLDRNFYSAKEERYVDFPEQQEQLTNLTPREIGTGLDANMYPMQALQAKIREGAAKVEITFMGAGKGHSQALTPESLGKMERQQLREMSNVNDVKFSKHATPNMMGVSGFNPQAGKFDPHTQHQTVKEITKAIEFAAEASTGGAVVFHTGEWQRPIYSAGRTLKQLDEADMCRAYNEEKQRAPIYLADPDTGKLVGIPQDQKFYFPVEEIDPITKDKRVKVNGDGTPVIKEYNFQEAVKYIREVVHKDDKEFQKKSAGEVAIYGLYEQQLKQAQGEVFRFSENIDTFRKELSKIREARDYVQRLWDITPESERYKLLEQVPGARTSEIASKYLARDSKKPMELLDEAEKNVTEQLRYHETIATASKERYQETYNLMNRLKPIEEVGIHRTKDALGQLGVKAYQATQQHKKNLKEDIYISPESFDPNYYGSHPEEIKTIIKGAREVMTQKLLDMKVTGDKKAAEDIAKKHIKGTLDSGHFNMWRQHWVVKENESYDDAMKRYEKWFLDQTKSLAKEGFIGHIHLTDNWGYDDEHLTPGQGNVPMKEFIKNMEDAGIKDFIVERGSFNGPTALPDTLAMLGSPIYKVGRRAVNFGTIWHGHFGYTAPPNYIVGAYSPSNEFKLWSEVPLE